MKKIVCFILIIAVLLVGAPCSYADGTDVVDAVAAFVDEHGTDVNGKGDIRYSAKMSGGGSFNINVDKKTGSISAWIENETKNGDEYDYYEFVMIFNKPFDGGCEWSCVIQDENGINPGNGTVAADDDRRTELVCDEYLGDDYLYDSFMYNAQMFRDTLVLAIANDLNYYFDENLDYFGLNEQFLCPDGHMYGEWVYQQNAGYDKNGTEKRQCEVCYATQEREKEGTQITMPDGTLIDPDTKQPVTDTSDTPAGTPADTVPDTEVSEPQTEIAAPAPEIEAAPEPEPEVEVEAAPEPEQNEQNEKKPLPSYAVPMIIVIAAVVIAATVVFVIIIRRSKNDTDDDSDIFTE